jgi:Uma2 family endonuclease
MVSMSPETERLLEAYHEKRTCPPAEKRQRVATFERLLAESLARKPGASRNEAELIEGTVYVPSPIRARKHAQPHARLAGWLIGYEAETPGVECFDNSTVRLDLDNEPQPDLALIKLPEKAGQARISADDYIEGVPELTVEIVGSSRAYDLHQKKAPTAATACWNIWLGLRAKTTCIGGHCGRENIMRWRRTPMACSRAACFPISGWTRGHCCAAT